MVFIFETHPVQYRAPVYQELQRLKPGSFHVFYATDCSVRGHLDREFKQNVQWDIPLLEGYPLTVLNNEKGQPLTDWKSLTGHGIFPLLKSERPQAVMLCQFSFQYSAAVFVSAILLRIPVWIKMETQDEAFQRSAFKNKVRSLIYRTLYRFVSRAFYIGEKNKQHFLKHGLRAEQLTRSPYCVPTNLDKCPEHEKQERRIRLRMALGIPNEAIVIGFFGKLIPKKNPEILIQAALRLPADLKEKIVLLFVGAGELEPYLQQLAARNNLNARFTGFINQSEISDYYLATDQLILASRYAGETWGLVVNEALHAGCSVIISEAVGCSAEFKNWERVRVIPVDEVEQCALSIQQLSRFTRSFDWCADAMKNYSVKTAADGIAAML